MNILTIAGNIGNARGPNSVGDKRVLNFSVAVQEGRDRTTWFDCALWGERADKLAPYIQKGGKITVTGSVSGDVYNDKAQLKVFVRDLTLQSKVEQAQQTEQKPAHDFDDDDALPF